MKDIWNEVPQNGLYVFLPFNPLLWIPSFPVDSKHLQLFRCLVPTVACSIYRILLPLVLVNSGESTCSIRRESHSGLFFEVLPRHFQSQVAWTAGDDSPNTTRIYLLWTRPPATSARKKIIWIWTLSPMLRRAAAARHHRAWEHLRASRITRIRVTRRLEGMFVAMRRRCWRSAYTDVEVSYTGKELQELVRFVVPTRPLFFTFVLSRASRGTEDVRLYSNNRTRAFMITVC